MYRNGTEDQIQRTKLIENQMTEKMTKQPKKQKKTIRPNSNASTTDYLYVRLIDKFFSNFLRSAYF